MTVPDPLDPAAGERLTDKDFFADFNHHYYRSTSFYKLERAQHFAEPHDPSWRAFNHGKWQESLELMNSRRTDLETDHREATASGITPRRIRFVEEPLAPYLQWELHLLRLRDEITGGTIRVLPAMFLAADERTYGFMLPEVCTMDDTVMYLHQYDEDGVQDHNIRYTDPAIIRPWREYIEGLWHYGWPVGDYFGRYVEHLPPPVPVNPLPDDYLEARSKHRPERRL